MLASRTNYVAGRNQIQNTTVLIFTNYNKTDVSVGVTVTVPGILLKGKLVETIFLTYVLTLNHHYESCDTASSYSTGAHTAHKTLSSQ